MDDEWVDYMPPQSAAPAPQGEWVDYQPAREPPQAHAAPPQDDWIDYQAPERQAQGPPPEAEGMFATGLRSFAHEAPAVAAGAAGAMAGAGIGAATPVPGGALIGGVAGAFAGGFGGGAAADEGLKLLGYDDSTQRAINAKTNPWSAAVGQGLAQVLGFGAGAASTAARVGGAAIGGGLEAGQQLYQGEFDPARLATQTAAGAVFTKPYGWGSRLEAQGAQLGERLRPKVEPHGSAGPESSVGIAEQATPAIRAENQTGDPQNKVTRSERDYPAEGTEPVAPGGGIHVGDVDPTLKAALDAKTADTAPSPVEAPSAAEARRPPMTVPAEGAQVTPEMAAPATPPPVEAVAARRPDMIRGPEPGAAEKVVKLEPVSVERATQMWGGDLPESGGGGSQQHFIIRNAAGEPEALAAISIKGKKANIDNIELLNEIQSGSTRLLTTVFEGPPQNLLGSSVIRGALREFQKAYPEITEITGVRVSGARFGGESVPREEGLNVGVKFRVEEAPTGAPVGKVGDFTILREGGPQGKSSWHVIDPETGRPIHDEPFISRLQAANAAHDEIQRRRTIPEEELGPEGVGTSTEAQGGGGGAQGPPGGPPGTPPSGALPPGPPPGGPPPTGGNAQQSILARIANATPATWRDKIPTNMAEAKTAWRQVYTAVKDELDPLAPFTEKLSQGRSLAAEEDPYKLARLTKGSFGRVEQMLNHGTFDFETGQSNGKPLREVLAPVKNNMDGFTAYAAAKRAIELEGRGVKTGMPLPEANSVVAQGARTYEPVFRELVDYQSRTLDYLQKSGILGADDVAKMRAVNKEFVPFYRLMDTGTELGQQLGAGLKVRDPVRSIKGSEREILNPIESIIKNTHAYVALAERNRVMLAMEKLAAAHPQGDQLMQRVIERHPVKVTPDEINKFMQEQRLPGQTAEAMTVFRPNAFRPAPDQIRLFKDGKSQIYKVDPPIAEAVNAMDPDSINTLTRILGAPARLLRTGVTQSPEFIIRNPARDQFSAMVNSKYGYVPVYDMVRGMGNLLKKDDIYQLWLKSGGANSATVSLDRKLIGMKPTDLAGQVKNVIRSPLEALRAASELMENSTKLGEFRRAIEQGASPVEAAYSSRDLMDFARMGARTKAINAIIPFFNAQIEGVDRAARAFKDNPTNFLTKVGLGITLPSTLLWFANKDDPRYRELPQWQKDLFWIVPTDHWTGMTKEQAAGIGDAHKRQLPDGTWQRNDGTIWRIPKPFELGVLFGSVPERILDAFFTAHPNSFKDLHKTVWGAFTPGFIPQAATPLIEQFANRSMFLDRPLVPKSLEKVQPKYQSTGYTSEVAKTLGGMISSFNKDTSFASPIVIDNYIRQWTGGLGAYAVNILDKGLRATGIAPDKIQPESTAADMPLLKAFAARFPAGSAQSVQDFYTTYDERKSAKATDTYLRKSGRDSERAGGPIQVAEGIHKALGNQQKFIRNVYSDMSMSPAEKRQLIDVTYLQMIETARRGNQILNKPTP